MPQQECYKCTKPCVTREEKGKLFGFPCDFCKEIICSECTGALAGEVRIIPSVSRTTLFLCPSCKDTIKMLPDIQKKMNKTVHQTQETVNSLEKLKEAVDSLKGSNERRKRENETLKGELLNLSREMKQVDQKISGGQSYAEALKKLEKKVETIKSPVDKGSESDVEETLHEMKEREIRASNILFFGVDESEKDDKVKDDKDKVSFLYKKMNLSLPEEAKIFRLGREMPDKKRPIKVVLPSREEAIKVLKSKKNLEEKVENVYIKSDKTETQRKYLKQVMADLEKQKTEGRLNLIIRYVNGTPKIVEKVAKN